MFCEPLIYSHLSEAQVTIWTFNCHLKWEGWGADLGDWALNIWYYLQAAIRRVELHCRTPNCCCRIAQCVENPHIWCQKCFECGVPSGGRVLRAERHRVTGVFFPSHTISIIHPAEERKRYGRITGKQLTVHAFSGSFLEAPIQPFCLSLIC